MKVIVAIPARIGSTRLPAKALADICGEPMVVRVWRRCSRVRGVAATLVATDDERIRAAVRAAGGRAVLTAASHVSGTDRIAEAVRGEDCDLVVNVQGDEPFVEAAPLEALIAAFAAPAPPDAATLATPVGSAADLLNPAVVKVLVGRDGYAVYFSRHPIPWREGLPAAGPAGRPIGRPSRSTRPDTCVTSASTRTVRRSCSGSRHSSRRSASAPNVSSSCGFSSTASGSGSC